DKKEITVTLSGRIEKYVNEKLEISPEKPFTTVVTLKDDVETDLTLAVKDTDGKEICSYIPLSDVYEKTPAPAQKCEKPCDIHSLEELYLTALHLEQYRHATYSPEDYYLEGLRRDKTDIRLNNAYGRYLYSHGEFEKAENHFKAAIKKSTWKNPNPYDCEPYYNLGLALRKQRKFDEAFDAFYKSIWSGSMQDKGFYQLACISAMRGNYKEALEFVEQSLIRGTHNLKARNLKTTLLRLSGRLMDAKLFALETMELDPLNYGCRYELYRVTDDFAILNELTVIMRNDVDSYIELSLDYNEFGLYDEAAKVLALISEADRPMLHYYMAYYSKSDVELDVASKCNCDYCFPVRLNDILVLRYAMEHNDKDANAPYLLGNLFYDKGQWENALKCWTISNELDGSNPIVHRNLALAYFNKLKDSEKAVREMERAFRLSPDNARIFYELDQLYKQTNYPVMKRLKLMADNMELVTSRDDLYTEFITLLNSVGYFDKAYKAITVHKFHPWEGGEGKITAQYKKTLMGLAYECIEKKDYDTANEYLQQAFVYPENLGEGKLYGTLDNDIYYMLGMTYEKIDFIKAKEYYTLAMRGGNDLSSAVYYNDQPPEMFFYQALAAKALGDTKTAKSKFNKLVYHGLEHMNDHIEIDYFAVSLPDFLIFDTDLDRKNRVDNAYLTSLGYIGLGDIKNAKKYILAGLNDDVSHQGLIELSKHIERN
ncbi:MAG: tetratricopeptide repeat protein, partial [Hominilimicola sp.]